MSADNGVYILITKDKFKKTGDHIWANQMLKGNDGVVAYRVAHCQAADNFDFYQKNEPHNVGAWMSDVFKRSEVCYNESEAMDQAHELAKKYDYLEYGIVTMDVRPMNFYGC